MKSYKLLFLLILIGLKGFSQDNKIPIAKEKLKRGIYQTFEEFKFNIPSITDSFYVESKIRKQRNWEGTTSFIPKYTKNNKRVKKVWGFSDGNKAYAFHQWEFFEIELDSSHIGFYGYKELSDADVAAIAFAAGAIGTAIAIDQAKKKKVYYNIDLLNGKFRSKDKIIDNSNKANASTKLVLYRRDKKEKNIPLNISINDTTSLQLIPNSLREFTIPITRDTIDICFGDNLNQCIDLVPISSKTQYIEGSISSKSGNPNLEQVKIEIGEFYSKQVKYLEEKRESKSE